MNTKTVTKILAAFLAFTLSFANVALLGIYTNETYAASSKLEEQETSISKTEIEFDAYFKENEQNVHSKIISQDEEAKLCLSLKLGEGYLTNARIKIENANFSIQENKDNLEKIQSISSSENIIVLNQIAKNESVTLEIPIKINAGSSFNASDLIKIAKIKLEGAYVNNKGKEIKIDKAIEVETSIDGIAESELSGEASKYVTYNIGGSKGVILQTLIKSKLVDNKLPVKQTKLEIEIPKINGIEPKTIAVSAKTQEASNGKTSKVFTEGEYKVENEKILLTLQNDNEILSWRKNVQDEIILTCIYAEEAIAEKSNIVLNASSEITYYGRTEKIAKSNISEDLELEEQIGDIVTLDLELSANELYKGYMLKENGKMTSFKDILSLNIGYSELVDKIVFKDEASYTDESGNTFLSNAYYTYTKIEKENLLEILGEEGYIKVYSNNGELITTLNKDNTEYKFEGKAENITFETSKPIIEGILKLENGREIKPLEYSKTQLEKFKEYKVNLTTNIYKDNAIIIKGTKTNKVKLENPKTDAKLELSKQNLSTVITNQGVELRVVLKTTDANSLLYKNPSLEIVLPSYVEKIDVENVKLLYEKELKLKNARIYRNANGNLVITIALEGEQRGYNDTAITEGATLVMNADIKVNELTPTKTEKVILNVKNENAKGDIATFETDMSFTAPTGMVTVNQITNYNDKNETATSISGKKEVGEIDTASNAKIAKVNMTVINNYDYTCDSIQILGRTPFEGNKSIKTGQDLGSTFSAKPVSTIVPTSGVSKEDVKIYYSANGEANKDLNNSANGWTEDPNTLTEIKSYMIDLKDQSLETGESVGFTYNVQIPANLEHNEDTYGVFSVYYQEHGENMEAGIAGLSTGEGPNLKLELTAKTQAGPLANSGAVEEGDTIGFTVKVSNESSHIAENVTVTAQIPANTYYVDDKDQIDTSIKEINSKIQIIEPGEAKDLYFTLRTAAYTSAAIENANKISLSVTAKAEEYNDVFSSNEFTSTITEVTENRIIMKVKSGMAGPLGKGSKMEYSATIGKNTSEILNNVVVTCEVPEGMKFLNANKNGEYDQNTRTITWRFEQFNGTGIVWNLEAEELPKGMSEREVNVQLKATFQGGARTFTSNILSRKVKGESFSISQTSTMSDGYITGGEEVTFVITTKNLGNSPTTVSIIDKLPKELVFQKYYYTKDGKLVQSSEKKGDLISLQTTLAAGETLTAHVVAKANTQTSTKEIINEVSVKGQSVTEKAENLTLTLVGKDPIPTPTMDPNDPNATPDPNKTYRISGVAWVDENNDGKRDSGEKLLEGIKVYLLNSTNNAKVKETTTNANGAYTFFDVPQGRYIVAFEYDEKAYDIAKYQADGIDSSMNSDAIKVNMTINGRTGYYAATNAITVSSNSYNVDLGLVNSPKFDMKLEKGIALVQVSNQKGVKSYKFNNEAIAQVQIEEKNMAGSVVAITYTFKVTNEGAVSGYVNKVVDYKAKDLSFSSTMNPEWYQDTKGDLYNTSLSGREIKPGETVELSLILTKTMTNENTGLSNNTAELAEVSNDLGLNDIDSTPGNKNTSEDDFGKADVIIAVKTGGILFYGGIVLVVLAIFALGAYEINKRVLRKI